MLRDLFFKIKARDETAAAFAKVKAGLKGVEGAVAGVEARVRRAAKAMAGPLAAGAAAAGAAIALAFSGSMAGYDAHLLVQTKVRNAVEKTGAAAGHTAEELIAMGDRLEAATRFDADDILDGVIAQMLTFGQVTGDTFERASMMALDLATQLGGDVQGSAIMLGKALNDPAKGLGALRKVGIQFSEDQEGVIKALVETGRVAEAQGLILDELGRQGYGGQAAAAAQVGLGPLIQMQHAFGAIKDVVGEVQSEALLPLVGVMRGLVDWFVALPEPVQKMTVILGTLGVTVVPLVASFGLLAIGLGALSLPVLAVAAGLAVLTAAVVAFWGPISTAASYIATTVSEMSALELAFLPVSLAARMLTDAFTALFPETAAAVESFASDVMGYLGGTVSEMSALERAFLPVSLAARMLGDLFAVLFPEAAAAVSNFVAEVRQYLAGVLNSILDSVIGKVRAVGDAFFDLWDRVTRNSYVPDMVDDISDEFGRLDSVMVETAVRQTDTVAGAFEGLGEGVGSSIRDMISTGELSFRGFASRMLDHANGMADGIVDNAFGRVAEAAGGIFGGGAGGGIGGFIGSIFKGLGGGSIPALDTGGEIEVGGRSGIDRNIAMMKVTRGETVSVNRKGQGGRAASIVVNIQTPSPAAFEASRGQVAASISRAVSRGGRNL